MERFDWACLVLYCDARCVYNSFKESFKTDGSMPLM